MGEAHTSSKPLPIQPIDHGRTTQTPTHEQLIHFLATTRGINESVVLGKDGSILSYQSNHPILKNSIAFIVSKATLAGGVFGFTGFRYVAMQRGGGKKLIILCGTEILVGLEADARCLQQLLLESLRPLLSTQLT